MFQPSRSAAFSPTMAMVWPKSRKNLPFIVESFFELQNGPNRRQRRGGFAAHIWRKRFVAFFSFFSSLWNFGFGSQINRTVPAQSLAFTVATKRFTVDNGQTIESAVSSPYIVVSVCVCVCAREPLDMHTLYRPDNSQTLKFSPS